MIENEIPCAGDLLHVYTFTPANEKKVPLMMEFPVSQEVGPVLISATKSLLWVAPKQSKVRAAFRPMDRDTFFPEVIQSIVNMGTEARWGNVQSLDSKGIQAGIAHILSYDIPSPEILAHRDVNWGDCVPNTIEGRETLYLFGCPIQWVDWLAKDTIVIVPQDRDFVGFVLLSGDRGLAVIHNAGRGVAVCKRAPV